MSVINTVRTNEENVLFLLLKPFTSSNYTVKDLFDWAKDITQQTSKLIMASFDVNSLFTNMSLHGTFDVCFNKLFNISQTVSGLKKQQVLKTISLTTK